MPMVKTVRGHVLSTVLMIYVTLYLENVSSVTLDSKGLAVKVVCETHIYLDFISRIFSFYYFNAMFPR